MPMTNVPDVVYVKEFAIQRPSRSTVNHSGEINVPSVWPVSITARSGLFSTAKGQKIKADIKTLRYQFLFNKFYLIKFFI